MLAILDSIDEHTTGVAALVALVAELRPRRRGNYIRAAANVRTLTQLLRGNPEHARQLRAYVLRLLQARRHASLYTEVGVLSNDGFFTELKRRIAYRMLPPALGDEYLADLLDQVFYKQSDWQWISAVPSLDWLDLFDTVFHRRDRKVMLPGMLEAIRTLSYRVAAVGLEPKLTNFHTEMEEFESPFLVQNREVLHYLDGYARLMAGEDIELDDPKHLLVMLDQCDSVIARIRRKALVQGTTIALTYLLVTLTQSIDRLRKLLFLVDVSGELRAEPSVNLVTGTVGTQPQRVPVTRQAQRRAATLALALELIEAHNNKYTVRDLFRDNIHLLARNVTENASRTGEHYIAENRRALGGMFLSAAGAGVIVGFMALFKILLGTLRAAPLVEAFLFSMNYSLGFVLIHLLHFTVATKQPAMTASHIAASLQSRDGRHIDPDSLAELITKVFRTQVTAVLGNIATCLPTAWVIAWGWLQLTGEHLVSQGKAMHLLHDIDPIHTPALFYAAIAGVCLFLAGLVSGYYDNQALYTRWGRRIAQLRGLNDLLGAERTIRLGRYLENNLGSLMGNFFFGIMLGMASALGLLLGLPIDIRHVTFSSANFATALVALDHNVSWQLVVTSVTGFLAIGAVNLLVSFGLALWVALRARRIPFEHGFLLLRALGSRLWKSPVDFFFGTKELK
ncbi:site-specific recombinase [Pseudoduganella albidiflava]|uniref:Recombinase n=1 Tax=Pseudoduganella albidiflava TaxID=321983 RepID=A0A411X1L8_9BURK|nr:site-specific recombinase [Pseudoduganella albidiflava]QBI02828.1 recombinase [Pseudoduganella albidiflava]GGY56665.1 recombinase [Pseudoduganella albidiflava]